MKWFHKYILPILFCVLFYDGVSQNNYELDSATQAYFNEIGLEMDSCVDTRLYNLVCHWIEVPYQYGGSDFSGIDCSSFSKLIYDSLYHCSLSGGSENLFQQCVPVEKELLEEGDFVFFKIAGNKISHVGIFLGKNKFVHATTKIGVTINDLDEEYYKKYF